MAKKLTDSKKEPINENNFIVVKIVCSIVVFFCVVVAFISILSATLTGYT